MIRLVLLLAVLAAGCRAPETQAEYFSQRRAWSNAGHPEMGGGGGYIPLPDR
jgi:hypothetical protein